MKYKWCLRGFLITLFLLSNSSLVFSQNDSISKSNIYTSTTSLQFGNELLLNNQIEISENLPEKWELSEPAMDFYHTRLVYDPVRDPKRLIFHTANYIGAAIVAFGILWVAPESFSKWDKDKMREEGIFTRWLENVKAGPIWDEDNFYLNWIVHPWAGAVYYTAARGSGLKWWESFLFSTFMSTLLWEYGVEAFAEIPSWQDIIITPVLGSAIGELFFIAKGQIIRNDKRVLNSRGLAVACLILIDPFNGLLNLEGYKSKNKVQYYSSIVRLNHDMASQKSSWGLQVGMRF